jgi:hypothetical protein
MLEMERGLATWELAEPPAAAGPVRAQALPEHRVAYLDYEGPISGGRGAVTRWDAGTYQVESQSETSLVVVLSGKILTGRATLNRTGEKPERWVFMLGKGERTKDEG